MNKRAESLNMKMWKWQSEETKKLDNEWENNEKNQTNKLNQWMDTQKRTHEDLWMWFMGCNKIKVTLEERFAIGGA